MYMYICSNVVMKNIILKCEDLYNYIEVHVCNNNIYYIYVCACVRMNAYIIQYNDLPTIRSVVLALLALLVIFINEFYSKQRGRPKPVKKFVNPFKIIILINIDFIDQLLSMT